MTKRLEFKIKALATSLMLVGAATATADVTWNKLLNAYIFLIW